MAGPSHPTPFLDGEGAVVSGTRASAGLGRIFWVVEWVRASRRWRPVFDPLTLALSRWERGRSFWACRRGTSRIGYFESRLTVRWRDHPTLLRSWVERGYRFGHIGRQGFGMYVLSHRWWCDGEAIAPYVAPFGNF